MDTNNKKGTKLVIDLAMIPKGVSIDHFLLVVKALEKSGYLINSFSNQNNGN